MTAQHGILKPNPVLFDLEKRKKKPVLAHELGAGAPCQICGDKCPGFQLHFWRKHCCNCHCGKIEHDVIEDVDPGFYFVGRIFDLPLRSKREELQFCYGTNSSDEENGGDNDKQKFSNKIKSRVSNKKNVKFDWIPPNVSDTLARRYLKELPTEVLPVAGSDGAKQRHRNLERQFPVHDVEPNQCHDLTDTELKSMQEFVSFVKENVAGQGIIQVVTPPINKKQKLILGNLDDPDWFPPPPPELLIDPASPKTSRLRKGDTVNGPVGTFHAVPYTSSESGSGRNSPYPSRHVDFSNPDDLANLLLHKADISESKSGLKCENCLEAIAPGQIAIRAERAGPKKMWHPRCFTCHTCKELLVDLLYYFDDGNMYCARDYADRKSMPRCHACDELIFCAEYTGAEETFWHIKHFCCFECDRPLAGHKYISVEGQPHCLICYQTKHGKLCISCGEYISPEDQRVSIDEKTHWHAKPDCFQCNICHSSLIGKKLAKKFGLILCSSECVRRASETLPNYTSNTQPILSTEF